MSSTSVSIGIQNIPRFWPVVYMLIDMPEGCDSNMNWQIAAFQNGVPIEGALVVTC